MERIYLALTIGLILSFVALGSPLTFHMIFKKFHNKKNSDKDKEDPYNEGDAVKNENSADEDEVKSKDKSDNKAKVKTDKKKD